MDGLRVVHVHVHVPVPGSALRVLLLIESNYYYTVVVVRMDHARHAIPVELF